MRKSTPTTATTTVTATMSKTSCSSSSSSSEEEQVEIVQEEDTQNGSSIIVSTASIKSNQVKIVLKSASFVDNCKEIDDDNNISKLQVISLF